MSMEKSPVPASRLVVAAREREVGIESVDANDPETTFRPPGFDRTSRVSFRPRRAQGRRPPCPCRWTTGQGDDRAPVPRRKAPARRLPGRFSRWRGGAGRHRGNRARNGAGWPAWSGPGAWRHLPAGCAGDPILPWRCPKCLRRARAGTGTGAATAVEPVSGALSPPRSRSGCRGTGRRRPGLPDRSRSAR